LSVPSSFSGLLTSNSAANAWCARAAVPASSSPAAASAIVSSLVRIIDLLP
jgi:hypothetical protein